MQPVLIKKEQCNPCKPLEPSEPTQSKELFKPAATRSEPTHPEPDTIFRLGLQTRKKPAKPDHEQASRRRGVLRRLPR
jgi:hypothetical protein